MNNNDDKTVLYPRQKLPDGQKPKPKPSIGLFDLLKSNAESGERRTGAGAAFAAFTAVQKASIGNDGKQVGTPADFLSRWKTLTIAKKSEQEQLGRRVDAVLKNVNMQGFKQASRARTWRIKLFWLGLSALLSTIMIYEIVKNVRDYQNSPITTKYTLHTPDLVDFPVVYLCYGSSYNRSYMMLNRDKIEIVRSYRSRSAVTKGGRNRRKRDLSQIFNGDDDDGTMISDEEINSILAQSSDYDNQEGGSILDFGRVKREANVSKPGGQNVTNAAKIKAKEEQRKLEKAKEEQRKLDELLMNSPNISDVVYNLMHEAGFNVEETFLECEFNGYTHQKLDCKQIVQPVLDPNYGICYLVQVPEDIKQSVAGQGLRLVLNSQIGLYPKGEDEGAPKYAGILVSVNKQYDPFNWLKSLAKAGQLTKIDLDATYVELLNLESGPLIQPCVDEDTGSDLLKIYKGNYSRTMCQMDCLAQAHRNTCQCIIPIDKNQVKVEVLNDTKFCGPKQVNNCLADSATTTEKLTTECRQQCHTPCKSYRYEMRSSFAELYEPAFSHFSLPIKQLIELRVAYSRKEIAQLIQQPSASFADLVSNVGGQANLWMGASMINLIQMAFMSMGYIFWRVYMRVHGVVKGKQ